MPVPNKIDTVLSLKFATARSGFPSPLKSPIAVEMEPAPAAKSLFAPKPPVRFVPVPKRTDTVLSSKLAVARSGFPSPFTSPMATDSGFPPVT